MSLLRNPMTHLAATLTANLSAMFYATKTVHDFQQQHLEENEARMDELEGTLRGHIGYIEEALDRLEGKAREEDRGKKM